MDLSFRHFAGIGDDYQSGTEPPHSKGCRHLNLLIAFDFNFSLSRAYQPCVVAACRRWDLGSYVQAGVLQKCEFAHHELHFCLTRPVFFTARW